MKYNKQLPIILGISAILLVVSVLAITSRSKNTLGSTNTPINDNLEDSNTSNDNEQSSKDNSVKDDILIEDENNKDNLLTEDENNDENNISNSNTQDKENMNTDITPPNKDNTVVSTGNLEIDKEGVYAINNHYFKSISPLDEKAIIKAADYMNSLQGTYLTDNNKVFYAVIPDKTYYDNSSNYEKFDYDKLVSILSENIESMEYISLKDLLSLDDYYRTDNHWRQEKIIDVANRIGEKLKFSINANSFEEKSYTGLKGMYSKYVTDTKDKEELLYLTNSHIANAAVDNYQNKKFTCVYDTNRLDTDISYDVFLSGATPFLTITNSSANSNKELVIFRDSYTSSLAPLLVSEYSKITLIDTRYIAIYLIKDFIEFDKQDVLFLYSCAVINHSSILK